MTQPTVRRAPRILNAVLMASLVTFLSVAAAPGERVQRGLGTYAVHHNALTTDRLPVSVAQAYGLRRSSELVLINIAVVRERPGALGAPVTASVTLSASNLAGQSKSISEVREVIEGDSIYYLATVSIAAHESLNIQVAVTPTDETGTIRFSFGQSFD